MRNYYVNPVARVGDTFGCFADFNAALAALRRFGRDFATHTVRLVADLGYVVTVRGYDLGGAR